MSDEEELQFLMLEQQFRHQDHERQHKYMIYGMWVGMFRFFAMIGLLGTVMCATIGARSESVVWGGITVIALFFSVCAKRERRNYAR